MTDNFYSMNEVNDIGFRSCGDKIYLSKNANIYNPQKIKLGSNVRIDDFCILSGRIEVGDNVHIAAYTALYGGDDGIFIGDYVNISSRVSIYSVSDDYSGDSLTSPVIPDKYKNVTSLPVRIRDHVIIGASSIILPGVQVAAGSAFGAFSFINSDSEPWSINVGIPYRKIKERSKKMLRYINEFEGRGEDQCSHVNRK